MHGEIDLKAKIGRGTNATFWVTFHKPQQREAVKQQPDLQSVPRSLQPNLSMTWSQSTPENLVDYRLLAPSPPETREASTATEMPYITAKRGSRMDDMSGRKIHILLVEDK